MNINKKTRFISTVSIVAALYVVVSLILGAFSFGAIQFRLGEMFNHLVTLNKKYIIPVALGCALVNLFSPLGMIDVVVGTFQTLLMLTVGYLIYRKIPNLKLRMAINTVVCSLMMFVIAFELVYIYSLPFWVTYASVAVGEAVSMTIGGIIIYQIQKRFDLKKQI